MKKQEYKERWEKRKQREKNGEEQVRIQKITIWAQRCLRHVSLLLVEPDRSGYGGKTAFGSQKSFFCGRSAF